MISSEKQQSVLNLLSFLSSHIGAGRKKQIYILLFFMVASSFAEVVSIGAILPFLGALTAPQTVFTSRLLAPFINFFNITAPNQLLIPLCLVFGVTIVIANTLRFLTLILTTRLSFAIGFDLSMTAYRNALFMPYSYHARINSAEITNAIGKAGNLVFGAVLPSLNIISSSLMLISILGALAVIDWFASLITFGGIGVIYLCLVKVTNGRLAYHSKRIAECSLMSSKMMQEGLGGIRDVLLDGTQNTFLNLYASYDLPYRRSSGSNMLIANSPSYGIETLGVLLIIIVAYILALEPRGVLSAVPILGSIALGAQRLMPVLQKLYGSWTEIRGNKSSFVDAIEILNKLPNLEYCNNNLPSMRFENSIALSNLSFQYEESSRPILNHLNLKIQKGSCVGVIGKTGSGKSTLLDVIMGLLVPTQGSLEIDSVKVTPKNMRSWQLHVAHVPQSIFLADSTVAANIAFGVPEDKIDLNRVIECAKCAQISSVIEEMPNGYLSLIGERGKRLSGGQRQRIGIARALYKNADVLVFDEATSALDSATEEVVIQSILNLAQKNERKLTIIMIAHRLSTLKSCSLVIELDQGEIIKCGTYEQVVLSNYS